MARRRSGGEDDVGEFPVGEETGEHGVTAEPQPTASSRPKEVTYLTPQGIQTISTDPTDLDDYEGEQATDRGNFGLKVVENDPQGRTHQLKNVEHFWAGTAEEYRLAFDKQ